MTEDNDDYEVGYGKPPKANQFKKGQSGNPSGAPKRIKPEKDHLTEVLGQKYTIQGPNGPMKLEGLGIVFRRMLKDAIDGKVGATKALFERIDANGIGRQPVEPELSEEDEAIARAILQQYGAGVVKGADDADR